MTTFDVIGGGWEEEGNVSRPERRSDSPGAAPPAPPAPPARALSDFMSDDEEALVNLRMETL